MELFHFDIETAGKYSDFNTFKQEDQKGANLFESKFHKMEWHLKYKDIDDAYLNNAGIISTYGRICCISFGFLGNDGEKKISSFYGDDEFDIVNSFNDLLKKIETKSFTLSGFRILHFDIPWILHKLHHHNIKPANIIYTYDKKPWELRIKDLSEDWKGKFAWAFSFDEVCHELGVQSPKDTMNGSLVHEYFWNNKYEEIKNYCEKDVSSSIDVGLKLFTK